MTESLSPSDDKAPRGAFPPALASALATTAFVVPYVLSRSTTPTPDHPRILFWYRTLDQPSIKPPDVAIPLAWTAIESGLAFAAYRLLRKPHSAARTTALAWWAGNVFGIGAWSRLFFGRRNLPAATVASAALGATSALYVRAAHKVDRPAARASVPLVAWVCFATVLTAAIWRRNR